MSLELRGMAASQGPPDNPSAAGFTVKSGWAVAVLIGGPVASPRLLDGRRIELSDPAIPESRQPYHATFGTARRAGPGRARLLASVRRFGSRSVDGLLREYGEAGHRLLGAGLVVGSLAAPEGLANAHIRIHALEGQLFRTVVLEAAERRGVRCGVWRDRDLREHAAEALEWSEEAMAATLIRLGRERTGPWRAEHKAAALAACLVLAGGLGKTPRPAGPREWNDRGALE